MKLLVPLSRKRQTKLELVLWRTYPITWQVLLDRTGGEDTCWRPRISGRHLDEPRSRDARRCVRQSLELRAKERHTAERPGSFELPARLDLLNLLTGRLRLTTSGEYARIAPPHETL